jgi:hypothetical protein
LSKDILEAEVVKSTDELASMVGESNRVTPEEPLERDNSGSHDRKPDERESRLASGQTRVEESAVIINILCLMDVETQTYPTPGIIKKTRAVQMIMKAISPLCMVSATISTTWLRMVADLIVYVQVLLQRVTTSGGGSVVSDKIGLARAGAAHDEIGRLVIMRFRFCH